jgi:hypothetical protein
LTTNGGNEREGKLQMTAEQCDKADFDRAMAEAARFVEEMTADIKANSCMAQLAQDIRAEQIRQGDDIH